MEAVPFAQICTVSRSKRAGDDSKNNKKEKNTSTGLSKAKAKERDEQTHSKSTAGGKRGKRESGRKREPACQGGAGKSAAAVREAKRTQDPELLELTGSEPLGLEEEQADPRTRTRVRYSGVRACV